jgi:hypothetical protein
MAGLRRREHKRPKPADQARHFEALLEMLNDNSTEYKLRLPLESFHGNGIMEFDSLPLEHLEKISETVDKLFMPKPRENPAPEDSEQPRRHVPQPTGYAMFGPSDFSDIKACHPDAGRIVLSKSYSKGDEPLTDAMIRRLDNDARRYQADREVSEAADARIPATAAADGAAVDTAEPKPHVPKNRRKREARRAAERNAQE